MLKILIIRHVSHSSHTSLSHLARIWFIRCETRTPPNRCKPFSIDTIMQRPKFGANEIHQKKWNQRCKWKAHAKIPAPIDRLLSLDFFILIFYSLQFIAWAWPMLSIQTDDFTSYYSYSIGFIYLLCHCVNHLR